MIDGMQYEVLKDPTELNQKLPHSGCSKLKTNLTNMLQRLSGSFLIAQYLRCLNKTNVVKDESYFGHSSSSEENIYNLTSYSDTELNRFREQSSWQEFLQPAYN